MSKCKYCGTEKFTGRQIGGHTVHCKKNPNSKTTGEKISRSNTGRKMEHPRKKCPNCLREITIQNLDRHMESCLAGRRKELKIGHISGYRIGENKYKCPHCGVVLKKMGIAGHIFRRHTEEGKKGNVGSRAPMYGREPWNKGLTKKDHPGIASGAEKNGRIMREKMKNGEEPFGLGYFGSERHRAASAKGGGYRGFRNSCHGGWVEDSYGNSTYLQSSYELRMAIILDNKELLWRRPKLDTFDWIDKNGKNRKYTPDFYLPEHDVYLDTKNDYLIKHDIEKVLRAMKLNKVVILVVSIKEIEYWETEMQE